MVNSKTKTPKETNTTAKTSPKGLRFKQFLQSDSFKAVAVLAIIALVSSLTLSIVHKYTKVDQQALLLERIGETYTAAPIAQELDTSGYANTDGSTILNAFAAEDGATIIVSKSQKAYNASYGITLFVVIKDGKIAGVSNYLSSETPGLGTRALDGNYLSQYVGITAAELAYEVSFKDPAKPSSVDIRYLTGATKSSVGVYIAVEAAATYYIREVAQ